jgi:MFS family permease
VTEGSERLELATEPKTVPVAAGSVVLPTLISLLPIASLATLYFVLPVLAPALMAHVERPAADYGWLGGAIGAGSVCFYFLNHAITPVLGPVGALRFGLLISIVGGMLLLSGLWPLMLIGGALTGFGYGTTTPAGSQILADFTPKSAWGTLFSIRQAGVPAGGVLAASIAYFSLQDYGWAAPLMGALIPVALTTLFLFNTPQRYNQARLPEAFSAGKLFDWRNIARPIRNIRQVDGLAVLVAAGAGLAMGHGAVTQFLVIYLSSGLGLPVARGAVLFAVMQACAIAGRIIIGALADRFASPMLALRLLAPLSAFACVTLALFDPDWSWAWQITATVIMGVSVGTWNGLYLAEVARRSPSSQISSATASSAVFTFLSYMITPPLVGALATLVGWRPTFALIALAPLSAGLLLWLPSARGTTR